MSAGSGRLIQGCHEKAVLIDTIDTHVPSTHTLHDEAKLFIERLSALVIGAHGEFDASKALGPRGLEGWFKQGRADTSTAIGVDDPYAQHAAVSINRSWLGQDIAPADDCVVSNSDKLRLSGANVFEDEVPHRLKGRCLEKCQEAVLPSNAIHGRPEPLDVLLGDGDDTMSYGRPTPQFRGNLPVPEVLRSALRFAISTCEANSAKPWFQAAPMSN